MSSHSASRRVGSLVRAKGRIDGALLTELASADLVPCKPDIQLSSSLIQGFVDKYLMTKFDNPVPSPPFHREMWNLACSEHKMVAVAAPRGHAKSSAITLAYILSVVLFRQKDFILLLSDTWGQSVEFLRDLKSELIENDEIVKDFEVKGFIKDAEDDVIVKMSDGHKFRIVARGSEQKVRGLKWNNRRPNLVVGDDLEGDEQVESKLRREKFMKWLLKAVLPVGSTDCQFRIVGTILHFDSALNRIIKNPSWKTKVYKAHKDFNDFSKILWPENFTAERLKAIRQVYINEGESDGYSCEYLNNPISEENAYFPRENLLTFKSDISKPLVYYAGWDFAVSKDQRSDYTVCAVVGVDAQGFKYLVDLRRGRMDAAEIVAEMFDVQKRWSPTHFVEGGVIKNSLLPFINAEMMTKQRYLNLVTINSTKDKQTRARNVQAMTKAKHLLFDERLSYWPEIEEEFTRFPKGEHDDIVDAVSIIGQGLEDIVPAQTEEEYDDEEFFRTHQEPEFGRSEVTGY